MTRDRWKKQLQEHPDRPQGRQRRQLDVLLALADLLDAETGTGRVALLELAKAAGVGERTARRAITWASTAGLLKQTSRGHRLGDGSTAASCWLLLGEAQCQPANSPPQPANSAGQPANSAKVSKSRPAGRATGKRRAARLCENDRPIAADGTCCAAHARQGGRP